MITGTASNNWTRRLLMFGKIKKDVYDGTRTNQSLDDPSFLSSIDCVSDYLVNNMSPGQLIDEIRIKQRAICINCIIFLIGKLYNFYNRGTVVLI